MDKFRKSGIMSNCHIAAHNDQSQREDALASWPGVWEAGYLGKFFIRQHHMYWNNFCIYCGERKSI